MAAPKENKGKEATSQLNKTHLYPLQKLLFLSLQITHMIASGVTVHALRLIFDKQRNDEQSTKFHSLEILQIST